MGIPRRRFSSAILLFASSLISASPQVASIPGDIVLRSPPVGGGCPISLSVQRTSPTEMVGAGNVERHQSAQRIHLTMDPLSTPGIRQAEIIVHAVSPKAHILSAGRSSSGLPLDRDFQISSSSISGVREKNLWVDGVGGIVSVDLTAITYIDGSTWQRSADSMCRAIPSLFLPVGDLVASPNNR